MAGSGEAPTVTLISPDEAHEDHEERLSNGWQPSSVAVVALIFVALLALFVVSGPDDRDASQPASPTTSVAPLVPAPAELGLEAGLVVGEPVGLVLAVGGSRQDLQVVDLDTGDVSSLGRQAMPQLISDGHLFLQDDWHRWDVIDLAEETIVPGAPTSEGILFSSAVAAEQGGVWFRHPREGTAQVWWRVDPGTGETLREVIVPPGATVTSDADGLPLAGPEIVGSAAGGVYLLEPDGSYTRVLEDRLVAFGEDLILVSRCDRSLQCENQWIDRHSLAPLEIPAPEPQLGGAVVRGDQILVAETLSVSGTVVKLYDIATGEAVAIGSPGGLSRTWVSPTGRFVAVPGYDAVLITDLWHGRSTRINRMHVDQTSQLVWGRADDVS